MAMNLAANDLLLKFGKVIALMLQGLCALVGAGFVLFILVVMLVTQGALTETLAPDGIPMTIAASPPTVISISLVIAANLTAMFFFFGKMRALIESVGKGDPFIPENARRLNAMAWLLLGAKVLAEIVGWLRLYLANLMDEQGANTFDFNLYDLHSFLIVLVLFILARVFRHGAAMREDLEGTV
jgi:hypothetical protein